MLHVDPAQRISVADVMTHEWIVNRHTLSTTPLDYGTADVKVVKVRMRHACFNTSP